MAQGQA